MRLGITPDARRKLKKLMYSMSWGMMSWLLLLLILLSTREKGYDADADADADADDADQIPNLEAWTQPPLVQSFQSLTTPNLLRIPSSLTPHLFLAFTGEVGP